MNATGYHTSAPDMRGRFTHTLREVMQRDYMPQIKRLHQRIDKLEGRPTSLVGYYSSPSHADASDTRLDEVLRRISSLRDDTNKHIQEINNQLRFLLEQGPEVGVCILL